MKHLFAKIPYEAEKGNDTVLSIVIEKQGSGPRGAGAMMLVGKTGRILGTIGGGLVERLAEKQAMECLEFRESKTCSYSLTEQADSGIGMACGGDMTVYFRYLDATDTKITEFCRELTNRLAHHKKGWLAVDLNSSEFSILDVDGRAAGKTLGQVPLNQGGCTRTEQMFAVPLAVGERAVIFGGGHCSQALCPILTSVGFRVCVMDCREEFTGKELFPTAEETVCGDYLKLSDYFSFSDEDYLVVMTNGHTHDFEVEEQLLRGPFAYLGVIGSARKTAAVNARLLEAGIEADIIEKVCTPIGTPIRAVTPEEIAVSIAGEMICRRAELREAEGVFAYGCPMH